MSGAAPVLASPTRRRRLAPPHEAVLLADDGGANDANWATQLSVLNSTDATARAGAAGSDEDENDKSATAPAGKTTATDLLYPPSFCESQLLTIVTRQVSRPKEGGGIKAPRTTRFPNLPHGSTWEFSGWGVTVHVELDVDSRRTIKGDGRVMGTLEACGLAGNDVFGSVFYAFPAVVAVGGVYSPISLFIATLLIFVYRPVMVELGSALPISGANYMYALHSGSKTFALVAATITLLDTLATGVVSAATAGAYLSGEIASLPFATLFLTFFILLGFTLVALCGLRESARVAFAILAMHGATLSALVIASTVLWAKHGNATLKANWDAGHADGSKPIPRAIFDGVCLGVLGLTGIETVPNTLGSIKLGRYPSVLRNLHFGAILLNGLLMLLVMAVLPLEVITSGANVLSAVAQAAGGRAFRIVVVVDACLVLCAGVLTGVTGAAGLLERMARDRVVPRTFLAELPYTGAQWLSIGSFVILASLIYASTSFSLAVCSQVFSMAYLLVLGFFPVTLFLLKISRPHLPRSSQTSLVLVIIAISLCVVLIGGNIALAPPSFAYFAAYFGAVFAMLWVCKELVTLLKLGCWLVDRLEWLRRGRLAAWGPWMVQSVRTLRRPPVCCLVKTDEIDQLFRMVLYVSNNESTSNVKLVHFYDAIDDIPSELEANATIVDEAFPAITVDLLFVQAPFDPGSLEALSSKLGVDRSMFFMTCPSARLPYTVDELGARVIA